MLSTHKRHPFGPVEFEEREIEHIYNTTIEPCGIAFAKRHEMSHIRRCGIVEDESVEEAVEDIAQSAREHKGNADEVAPGDIATQEFYYIIYKECGGNDAKTRQQELVKELHTKGHAVVLDKGDAEPRSNRDAFVERHVRLHPNLNELVDAHATEDNAYDGKEFSAYGFCHSSLRY